MCDSVCLSVKEEGHGKQFIPKELFSELIELDTKSWSLLTHPARVLATDLRSTLYLRAAGKISLKSKLTVWRPGGSEGARFQSCCPQMFYRGRGFHYRRLLWRTFANEAKRRAMGFFAACAALHLVHIQTDHVTRSIN